MERQRQSSSTSEQLRQIVEIACSLIEGPLEARLAVAIQRAPQALGLESAAIFLVREDFAGLSRRLTVPGVDLVDLQPRAQGFTAQVARTGRTVVIHDASSRPEVNPRVLSAGVRAFLAVPLNSSAGCLGVLYLGQRAPRKFSRADIRMAEAIGDMVGQAVENARLQERERAAREALEAERGHLASLTGVLNSALQEADLLREVAQEASSALNVPELLERVLPRLQKAMPVEAGSILLRDREQLVAAAAAGAERERNAGQRFRRSQQAIWRVVDGGEPLLEGVRRARGPVTLLVPLRWRDETFGILELNAARGRGFDVPDLNLARKVAAQVAPWIRAIRA